MRSEKGFTLAEVLIATGIMSVVVVAWIVIFSNFTKFTYGSSGTVTISSEVIPLAPSRPLQASAENLMGQIREDLRLSRLVLATTGEIQSDYFGVAGAIPIGRNIATDNLVNPVYTRTMLAANGVPFTTANGFSLIFLNSDGGIVSILTCSYSDTTTMRIYSVRRNGRGSGTGSPIAFRFAEPIGKTQPVPSLVASTGPAFYFTVRLPDPMCRLSEVLFTLDKITDTTARATAYASVRRSARYAFFVYQRD